MDEDRFSCLSTKIVYGWGPSWGDYDTGLDLLPIPYLPHRHLSIYIILCFYRLMSQLADVNAQSTVGMFHFYDVLHCFQCMFCTWLLCIF